MKTWIPADSNRLWIRRSAICTVCLDTQPDGEGKGARRWCVCISTSDAETPYWIHSEPTEEQARAWAQRNILGSE